MNIKLGYALSTLMVALCYSNVDAGFLKKFSSDEAKKSADTESAVNSEDGVDKDTSVEEEAAEQVASNESKEIVGDPVVLKIGSESFTKNKIMEGAKKLPAQLTKGMNEAKLLKQLIDQKIMNYILKAEAKKSKVAATKAFKSMLAAMEDELMVEMYLKDGIFKEASEESALKARYKKYVDEFKQGDEHHLHQIVVDTRSDADTVSGDLKAGKDFGELAKKHSKAPSKDRGGDEGFVSLHNLPEHIKNHVMKLRKGEHSTDYVEHEKNFHFFKVHDVRQTSPKTFEEMKPLITQWLILEKLNNLVITLRPQYVVVEYNEDGSPKKSDKIS